MPHSRPLAKRHQLQIARLRSDHRQSFLTGPDRCPSSSTTERGAIGHDGVPGRAAQDAGGADKRGLFRSRRSGERNRCARHGQPQVTTRSSSHPRSSTHVRRQRSDEAGRPRNSIFPHSPKTRCFTSARTGATVERANRPTARDRSPPAPAGPEMRQAKKERRRRIDPTTFEKQYTADELEFMNAMQRFKEGFRQELPHARRSAQGGRSSRLSSRRRRSGTRPGRRDRDQRRSRRVDVPELIAGIDGCIVHRGSG